MEFYVRNYSERKPDAKGSLMRRYRWLALLFLLALPLEAQVDTSRGVVARDTLTARFTSTVPGCYYPGLVAVRGDTVKSVLAHSVRCWDTASGVIPPPPPPPPSGSVLWFSDWRTGQLLDGGKWTGTSGTGTTWLSLVPGPALGFLTVNALRVNLTTSTVSQMLMVVGKWAAPAVGATIYYRVYYRNAFGDGIDNGGYHPMQNGLSNLSWEWKPGTNVAGSVLLEWWNQPTSGFDYPYTRFSLPAGKVLVNHTYRLEWSITRSTSTTALAHIRLYDGETQVASENDFVAMDGRTGSLGSTQRPMTLNINDATFTQINLGNNGPGATSRPASSLEYWAAFAVCTSWCGPYTSGG